MAIVTSWFAVGSGLAGSPAALRHVESERCVGTSTFMVHAGEDWHQGVHVVVNLHARLVGCRAKDATDVLHHAPLEPDRERQEQGVERRTIESLPEQAGR